MTNAKIPEVENKGIVATATKHELEQLGYNLPAVAPKLKASEAPWPRGTKPTILLAEADARARDFGRLVLEEQGYEILVAADGVEAVEIFRQAPERIDLVIVDLNIPRLTGDAVLARLVKLDAKVAVLFSSSYFAEDRSDGGSHLLGLISKPYLRQELLEMVQYALARCSELTISSRANVSRERECQEPDYAARHQAIRPSSSI